MICACFVIFFCGFVQKIHLLYIMCLNCVVLRWVGLKISSFLFFCIICLNCVSMLPKFFKDDNLSSFVQRLNTYVSLFLIPFISFNFSLHDLLCLYFDDILWVGLKISSFLHYVLELCNFRWVGPKFLSCYMVCLNC